MDLTQYVLLAAVIAGVTEFINRLRGRDYWTALTIFTAAVTGGIFGGFGVEGLNVVTGIAAGFGTSGGFSALGKVGQHTSSTPSQPIK